MPQIIVTADRGTAFEDGTVTLRERVNVSDFESQHFATQLIERLGWAVEDALQAEREQEEPVAEREQEEPVSAEAVGQAWSAPERVGV